MKNIIRMSLVAGALVTSVAAQAQTAWTDKVTFGGDLRFRLNSIDDESTGATDSKYMNNQIRGRLSVSGKVNEAMTANFRIASDEGSFRSANHNLGTANGDTDIVFELAYGDWRVMPGLVVSMGKAPNPFWQAGKNEMIWDADLPFDGATAKWTADMDTLKPFANLSYGQTADVDGPGTPSANPTLFGAQVGTSLGLGDTMNATVAVGYYSFAGPNSGIAAGGLTKNPTLLNVTAELGLNMVANLPMAVYADYVQNQDGVVSKEEKGFLGGLKVGQFANVGSWEAWYNYRDVGNEAVVAGLADSEFAAGDGAGVLGHQVGAGYMAWDNTTVGLNYWMAKRAATESDYNRITADLIWKF